MEWITPMQWDNEGVEPSAALKKDGFKPKYKPAANTFNYFLHKTYESIKQLQQEFDNRIVVAKRIEDTVDGAGNKVCNYTATVEGITELYNGMEITIIPDKTSQHVVEGVQKLNLITLNINNLGAVNVRQPLSFSTFVATSAERNSFLHANTPCRLMYHANYTSGGIWLMADKQKTSAQDLYGTVPVTSGGTGATTADEARQNLGIVLSNSIEKGSTNIVMSGGLYEAFNNRLFLASLKKDSSNFLSIPESIADKIIGCNILLVFRKSYKDGNVHSIHTESCIVSIPSSSDFDTAYITSSCKINFGTPSYYGNIGFSKNGTVYNGGQLEVNGLDALSANEDLYVEATILGNCAGAAEYTIYDGEVTIE